MARQYKKQIPNYKRTATKGGGHWGKPNYGSTTNIGTGNKKWGEQPNPRFWHTDWIIARQLLRNDINLIIPTREEWKNNPTARVWVKQLYRRLSNRHSYGSRDRLTDTKIRSVRKIQVEINAIEHDETCSEWDVRFKSSLLSTELERRKPESIWKFKNPQQMGCLLPRLLVQYWKGGNRKAFESSEPSWLSRDAVLQ